ncbi:MAG: hypothetical protein Q8R37_02550 [Nanoarchaeota archaeon]|nr:hypothetical protein [Nanoarchaeota archaeon]
MGIIYDDDIDSICNYSSIDNTARPRASLIKPHLSNESRQTLATILTSENELLQLSYIHSRVIKKTLHQGTEEEPIAYKETRIDSYVTTFDGMTLTFTREIGAEVTAEGKLIDFWDTWYNINAVKDSQQILDVDKEEPFDLFEKIEKLYNLPF